MKKTQVNQIRQKVAERSAYFNVSPDHDDSGHFYKTDDQRYPSVTGMLQILKDPALYNWKMNRALEYIWTNFNSITPETLMEHIEYAKTAPTSEMNNAGSIGNMVHNWREEWFQGALQREEIVPNNIPLPTEHPAVISGCRGIQKFVTEHDYVPVACELPVASHELRIGGTIDDIGYVDGKLSLVDLKTSNSGDKESYYAQVALYLYMFRKAYGLRPSKLYILHVSKDFGDYNLIEIPDIAWTISWAKKVVEVGHGLEQIKQSKKKKYNQI